MWTKIKTTDNRAKVKEQKLQHSCLNKRTWTRRCTWLENPDIPDKIKLKFEWDNQYKEVLVPIGFADLVWARWKFGYNVDDCCSIFTQPVPKSMQSIKEARQNER